MAGDEQRRRRLLGVDTGGTFTDFVLIDEDGELRIHKTLSTPSAPEQAILKGIAELAIPLDELIVVHGTTVATNTALEGQGVRTIFVTNRGLRDLLTIGRQTRQALYDLQPDRIPPPVAREHCLEVGGRLAADGTVVEELTSDDIEGLRNRIAEIDPEAVAICLLFSFIDDRYERALAAAVPDGVFVSRSSEVLPEYGEYERAMACWLNAWVGPIMERYLNRLGLALPTVPIDVMQSSAQTIGARQASRQGVRLLLSGPAGGLAGAHFIARQHESRPRLLSFDMGGTSTDVAVIDGDIQLTHQGRIGPYPIAIPMVDIHTVGAGGGSLATIDAGGVLQVGPRSAGASPGPACYGLGGRQATVTDANLVLGHLSAQAFLGGRMYLDHEAAEQAIDTLADRLGLDRRATARGIIDIANEHMAQALRKIATDRGIDPAEFTLTSFGGAGGLHACALAEALDIRRILVPRHAGVLSALGMLVSPRGRELSHTIARPLSETDPAWLTARLEALEHEGRLALTEEGADAGGISAQWRVALRYRGQSTTIDCPIDDGLVEPDGLSARFIALHERLHGHRLDLPIEVVTLRVGINARPPELTLPRMTREPAKTAPRSHDDALPVIARDDITVAQVIPGPALVTETIATTLVSDGWQAHADDWGHLWLTPIDGRHRGTGTS